MKKITEHQRPQRPVRVLQFGGGVFLRGFFDWMLQKTNDNGAFNGNAVIVRSKTRGTDPMAAQDFLYTHIARDAEHTDVTVVDSITGSIDTEKEFGAFLKTAQTPEVDVIVSNTTEAGIVYKYCEFADETCAPETFPAKLAAWLQKRSVCGGPVLILPCELIEHNGDKLREIVLQHIQDWKLPGWEKTVAFIEKDCRFCNTLVDRIVSGAPTEGMKLPIAYEDALVNTSEYFHLFAIEGEEDPRLPFAQQGLNVKWVPNIDDYHMLKVRILNGAHTSMIPYALLRGVATVGECMKDEILRAHLEGCLFEEILPALEFDPKEAMDYAQSVIRRFENPHISHACAAISLNSVSKFKVRVLPSILAYRNKFGKNPMHLTFALAKLIDFYKTGTPRDEAEAVEALQKGSIAEILSNTALWGMDLSFLTEEVAQYADSSK